MSNIDNKYETFGGWLLVLFIGQIASVVLNSFTLILNWGQLFALPVVFRSAIMPLQILSTIQVGLMIACSVYILAFLKVRSQTALQNVKKGFILVNVINIAFALIVGFVGQSIYGRLVFSWSGIAFAIGILAIWLNYFKKSERVKVYYNPTVYTFEDTIVEPLV